MKKVRKNEEKMKKKETKDNRKKLIYTIIMLIIFTLVAYICPELLDEAYGLKQIYINDEYVENVYNLEDIPEYKGMSYILVNDNIPYFTKSEYTTKSFEKYSTLDSLGRCGVAYANICKEIMPAKGNERGDISSIKPSGWKQAKYGEEFLYNRCHLIGYQLSNESANERNLITGTRYFNVTGMLPFENKVAEYINQNKNNHVLYRVTPIYKGNNLLASGVEIEAYSVEDNGRGVCFNVYIYNVEPGIEINYSNGKSCKK